MDSASDSVKFLTHLKKTWVKVLWQFTYLEQYRVQLVSGILDVTSLSPAELSTSLTQDMSLTWPSLIFLNYLLYLFICWFVWDRALWYHPGHSQTSVSQAAGTTGAHLVTWLTISHLPPLTPGRTCFFILRRSRGQWGGSAVKDIASKPDDLIGGRRETIPEGCPLTSTYISWYACLSNPAPWNKIIKILEKILNLFVFLKNIYCTKNNFISKFVKELRQHICRAI